MARYEHLPIYRAAFDLAVHLERQVKNFSLPVLSSNSDSLVESVDQVAVAREATC